VQITNASDPLVIRKRFIKSTMGQKLTKIENFGKEILPEFHNTLSEIQTSNPKWSKKRIFDTLFEIGEKKHAPNNKISDKQFGQLFTSLLTKTNMEYSCYLAYGAGCVRGAYGSKVSGSDFFELVKPIAKVGKEEFIN
jgi:hypothetical protein